MARHYDSEDAVISQVDADVIPKSGANLVGEDRLGREDPLYLIGHYPDEASANAARDMMKRSPGYNGDLLFVYLPEGAERAVPFTAGYNHAQYEPTESWEDAERPWDPTDGDDGGAVTRTDDWNEELHPRNPAGGPGGGQFTSGGGGGGGGTGPIGSPMHKAGGGGSHGGGGAHEPPPHTRVVGLHRLTTTKVNTEKVLEKSGLPKDKLYNPDEPPAKPPERAIERAALAKVLTLQPTPPPPEHDHAKDGSWDNQTKTYKLGTDAERVLKQLTPDQHEALRKYSNRYDFAMKQVEIGADRTKLAAGSEAFWKNSLAGKGIDVDKMSPAEKAQTFQKHFGHASGAEFVEAAAKAVDGVHDTFAKVAPTPGVAYRGLNNIPPDHVEKILNSKTMTLDSMSSFSFDHQVAHDYATGAQASKAAGTDVSKSSKYGDDKVLPNGVQVVMRLTHKSGINMMGASDFKKEQEVLIPKGTRFRLTHVTREGHFDSQKLNDKDPPIVVVHMEEI